MREKVLTVIISTVFLDYFISVTSSGNIATQYKNTIQINVTHAE